MARILLFYIYIAVMYARIDGEVYLDRPKIKTSDGDLILEPAYDKNIFLHPNGPKSSVFVGEVSILNVQPNPDTAKADEPNNKIEEMLNGPSGILQRLEQLESKATPIANDLFVNISMLWRKFNSLQRAALNLQAQVLRRKDECESLPCQNGGTCLNLFNGYYCLCPKNWEGTDCDVDVNECRNFIGTDLGCQNGATCINKPGYYECLCRSGWFGLHCTRKAKDCSGGDFEMCGHGTCLKVDTGDGVTCICHQGWTTNGTGVECLTDVNECDHQSTRCSVNPKVECINLPGSFRCGQCPQGYQGDGYTCADIDECTNTPNGGCNQMVACHNTIGSRICGPCPTGYEGDGVTCSWKGSCNINHGGCHPSAECVENVSLGRTAQCNCPNGMDGDGVGIHGCYISSSNFTESCLSNPCGTHGQCHTLRSGYTCICQRGYGGSHCDIPNDYCSANPCRNGGICRQDVSTTTGFRCECTAQYSGPLCQTLLKTCGGLLDAEEGSIIYPLTNTTYIHNFRCAWVIHTLESKVLNVTFSKFSLEESTDCSFDFLQIHDGRSSASQLIGRFCGNSLPKGGNIISSHNNLYFWFRSDGTVAKYGFALHWTSIDPVCGEEVDAKTHGHISSPGSPGNYPPNRDCYWHLRTNLGKKIKLLFFALDIESHSNCSYDYLAIYDGMQNTDPLLSKYCSSLQPPPLISAGSDILIHFHSDAYGSGTGFQIAYVSIPGVPGCGGYFTDDYGEITAPSFNGTYLNNVVCEYKIKVSDDTTIRIDFKRFNIESSNRCRFDYLKIYDGPSEESPLVGKFCGTSHPKFYVSSSNRLFIRFRSDASKSGEGFKLSYIALCQVSYFGDSGVIKSPGYPFNYPVKKTCEYVIGTTPGKVIQITFQDFNIESSYNCKYDFVEIRDGADVNSTLLGKYCGDTDQTPPIQLSTYNYMYIKFHSDSTRTGTGFYANYTTISTECGGIYRSRNGLIDYPSGNISEIYKNDQFCTWILIAPEGMHIMLTWNRFELEEKYACIYDYLELIEIDENDSNKNTNMGKFCGTKSPPALTTISNRVMINFKSNGSVRFSGFSLSYTFFDEKFQCGGNYFSTHGFIYSPGWPHNYEINQDCTWVITVPVGQQIRLNITQFDLEPSFRRENCRQVDYLEIRNGPTKNSSLIGQYCGSFQSKLVTSIANCLYIRFHSDYYYTGKGFKLQWDGSVLGCGGTLSSSTGSISSPNYPDMYNENTECFYRIATSHGSRIRISFSDLDLELSSDCRDDYVEIFDGRDSDAYSLGKYCFMSNALNNIETKSNHAFIKFRSDFFMAGRGFLLNYFTICNNNLTGRYGVIESPDYPNSYPVNLNCVWNITVPNGNKINVTFIHFDIFVYTYGYFGHNNIFCYPDSLQWKEITETKYGRNYCGNKAPSMISTKSNSLQIKFTSRDYLPKTGFRLEWVSYGCGAHIQKRSGSVSFDRNIVSPGELECEWLIETPAGTSVSLVISEIFLTETPNCTTDVIEMYNGQDVTSPLLLTTCHRHMSTVQSTANFMFIKFIKRSKLKGAYFTANFTSAESTCGGNYHSLSGYMYSKNYPKNYDDNLDCIWIISVPVNHRIKLNIIDFDLYSYPYYDPENKHICDDFIKIFDNQNLTDMNYTSKICPDSTVKQIITKHNTVKVQFSSDREGSAKGFKLFFSITCGAYITAVSDGVISNENYTGSLNNNCTWTIRAAQPDQKISLTITHIFLPIFSEISSNRSCGSSSLRVYDGDDTDAPLIDEYCGKKAPPMIVSRGSAITVLLFSYSNHSIGRFAAHYSTLNEACGGTLYSEEGSIASPNYPRSYPTESNCEWILSTSPGNKVYVTFELFELEYSAGCTEDYLEIRENNGVGKLLAVYCGTDIPINTTTASKLYIRFHSNDRNSGKGFVLHYGFLHGNELINMDKGEIASPLYPHLYQGAAVYSWRILSKSLEDITIIIDNLEIPGFGNVCNSYLSIYDGYDDTAPLLSEFCGKLSHPVEVLHTSSNMAYIKLLLDESNSGSLFHLKWENKDVADDEKQINCGSNYTKLIPAGHYSMFSSPHFPENYANDLLCEWTFQAMTGQHLKLNFLEFKLEQTLQCIGDYVNIYTTDIAGLWVPVKENICKSQDTLQVINGTRYMKITLNTDATVGRKGFQGKVSSICGGDITELSGEVGVTWNDFYMGSSILYNTNCEWTVKVRPGRLIDFYFSHFNISTISDHCITSVVLRNGATAEAPLLSSGKYCGYSHEKRDKLTTSSNSLHISYNSGASRYSSLNFQNFVIRYEERNIECGVTSKLDDTQSWEVISSPNYPSLPHSFSECIWVFTGPPGEILRIDFIDNFDLDNVDGCETEFIEIRDGSSNLSPILGRYCDESPGTVKAKNNALHIRYLTQLSEPRNGFKANVSIDICGGTIVAEDGEIKSPGYPYMMSLPIGSVCEWRIKGVQNMVFKITPQDIDLVKPENLCATNVTVEQYERVTNTTVLLRTFCDERPGDSGSTIESSTNEFIIKLHVGKPSERSHRMQRRGFRFTYNSSFPICGGSVTTPEGYLTTPGYPNEIVSLFCGWQITVPDRTRRVRLELIDANPYKNTIGLFNGHSTKSVILKLSDFGNSPSVRVYEATSNKMLVVIFSVSNIRSKFKAKFSSEEEALCGGNLNGLSGQLSSPNINKPYECEWHYNAQTDNDDIVYNTILVTASVNSSTARSRCRYDDPGLSVKAKLVQQDLTFSQEICGITQSTFIIPASAIEITALQTYYSLYFNLEWKSQPCGGIINIGEYTENILKIPENVNDTLNCAWIVATPYNTRVELKMEGSFQYNCDDEFVKIAQDINPLEPLIGDYCKGKILDDPLVVNFRYIYIQYHTKATNSSSIKLTAKTVKNQCGGLITTFSSVFSTPNYPKNYEPNEECSWFITAEQGFTISLSFVEHFAVEQSPNCTKDAVVIYDWKDDTYDEIAKICGREIPTSFNSTYNKMKVVLRTDNTTNMDGFKALWTPICGGRYIATDNAQLLYSPLFPNVYPRSSDCTYEITAPYDKMILIQFLEFELEGPYPDCMYDNITIIGENDFRSNYQIQTYCENKLPPIISNYNKITIHFKSDKYIQSKGFKISFQIYNCGGQVKEPIILSSQHGDVYNSDMNCTWFIEAPKDKQVVLKFQFIDLESGYDCSNDFVAVYDDLLISNDKRLGLMCGRVNSPLVLKSHGNKALLQFVSDYSNSFKGFKVNIFFTYSESAGCGGHIDLTISSTKTFRSPLIGKDVYENYLDCHWTISSPPDTIIKIEFTSFNVSSCLNVNQSVIGFNKCDCDLVEVTNGLNPDSIAMGTYCGDNFPPTLHSSGNQMSVRLSTDGELSSSGFEARLTVQQSVCGQSLFTVKNKVTRIKSPGYETGIIPRSIHCEYYLDVVNNIYFNVRISIVDLDLQPPYEQGGVKICSGDKIVISTTPISRNVSIGKDFIVNLASGSFISTDYFSLDEIDFPKRMEYCGSTKPSDLYVTGSVSISLTTSAESDSKPHKGFEIEFSFTGFCDRNYTGTQGKIRWSLDSYYEINEESHELRDCYTLIIAPDNHTISAYFISIQPSYANDDTYLEIFDGDSTSSKKLVTFNNEYEDEISLFTTGRYMLMHSRVVGNDHVPFDMNFITTDKGSGCGGKVSNVLGRVTSPMYPNVYRQRSTCEWEIETPVGTHLKLHFEVFDLGRVCDQNYLQLVDSKGVVVSSFCSEKPADYTSSDNFIKIVFYTTMNNSGTGWVVDFVGIM